MNTQDSNDGSTEQVDILQPVSKELKTAIRLRLIANIERACIARFGDTGYFTSDYWRAIDPQPGEVAAVVLSTGWYYEQPAEHVNALLGKADYFFVTLFTENKEISELDAGWLHLLEFLDYLDSEEFAERQRLIEEQALYAEIGWKDKIYTLLLVDKTERTFKNVPQLALKVGIPAEKLKCYLSRWSAEKNEHLFTVQLIKRGVKDRSIKLVTSGYDVHAEWAKQEAQTGYDNQKKSEEYFKAKGYSNAKYPDTREESAVSYHRQSAEKAEKARAADLASFYRRQEIPDAIPAPDESGLRRAFEELYNDPLFQPLPPYHEDDDDDIDELVSRMVNPQKKPNTGIDFQMQLETDFVKYASMSDEERMAEIGIDIEDFD